MSPLDPILQTMSKLKKKCKLFVESPNLLSSKSRPQLVFSLHSSHPTGPSLTDERPPKSQSPPFRLFRDLLSVFYPERIR